MKFYLAARYNRREELCSYRETLRQLGAEVTSRWLDGTHEVGGVGDTGNPPPELARRFARDDLEDIGRSDALVAFTEEERTGPTRGGRHVEFGYALEFLDTIVIGPVENVFHALADAFYGSFEEFLAGYFDGRDWRL